MFPSPASLSVSTYGRLTATNIGLLALRLPGVAPMTSLPERTCVVTRSSRLLSAWTMTDCVAPTWTVTLLSTPVKGGSDRVCVAATPEPVPAGLPALWKTIRSTSRVMRVAASAVAHSYETEARLPPPAKAR